MALLLATEREGLPQALAHGGVPGWCIFSRSGILSSDGNGMDNLDPAEGNVQILDIQDELRNSYLTYAMSVIISRALPDVRDGLKPSQRRILVAMNDLNLGPSSSRVKCAKITGDASGNYHPHGNESLYLTLARMAQTWVMREVLIDKQGNFGNLAGLPPAAMRYTEARLSAVASDILADLDRDTVDFVPTYDQRLLEPVVLPARVPNLLINGATGIAVGMATSIPPHNLAETCSAVITLIDNPDAQIDDLLDAMEGPDFPTGGVICGRYGIRQGYMTGRSTIVVRARTHFETENKSDVIVVTEIPYLETRDRIREKLELLVREEKVKGISRIVDLTDRTLPDWQVRLHIIIKKDADKEVVLNQLFQYSPLQGTFSIILLGLIGNRPQTLTLKQMLQEFLRHRIDVLRRRTQFLLNEARKRKHIVEGLLIAQLDIDQVIDTIRRSPSRAEARVRLQDIQVPAELIQRALGDEGFHHLQLERGVAEFYSLSQTQAEAIVSMQLGSLAGLERGKLGDEFQSLLVEITEYLRILSSEANIIALVRAEMEEMRTKYGSKRRTTISDEELGEVTREDLIAEETMVVTLSHRGYIKRMELSAYKAQNRGGRGITGAKTDDEDPIEHLFIASTHAYLLFFTDRGKVFWQKVYDIPLQGRTAKGRALVNLLSLQDGEKVFNCLAVREFDAHRHLIMATRKGIVKKTPLTEYSRPKSGGIIAIKLDEGDELIDVVIVGPQEDVLLATSAGMAIRFAHHDARSMGRNTRGVKGITLSKEDTVVGMVVAHPEMELLTVCENGYGKRTPFGNIAPVVAIEAENAVGTDVDGSETGDDVDNGAASEAEPADVDDVAENLEAGDDATGEPGEATSRSGMQYRRQKRGGKGLINIRTSDRNGLVVDVIGITEEDEVLMVTAGGIIQRIRVRDVSRVGRGTQGVRIIKLDEGDKLVSLARVPSDDIEAEAAAVASEVAALPPAAPTIGESDTNGSEPADTSDDTDNGTAEE